MYIIRHERRKHARQVIDSEQDTMSQCALCLQKFSSMPALRLHACTCTGFNPATSLDQAVLRRFTLHDEQVDRQIELRGSKANASDSSSKANARDSSSSNSNSNSSSNTSSNN